MPLNTVLITGANRGIGLEFVKQYLNSAEWTVIACVRSSTHEDSLLQLSAPQKKLHIIHCDVSHPEQIQTIPTQLEQKNIQEIDLLLNVAGIFNPEENIFEANVNDWLKSFQVNTIAPALVAKACLPLLQKGRLKTIVNTSSVMGSIAANTEGDRAVYRSSKAALNSVTRSMAGTLRKENIAVVSVHPGWVQTDMGGVNAPLLPQQSVANMIQTISRFSLKDSGSFVDHSGQTLDW